MARKLGISHDVMLDRFDTVNLNAELHGTHGKYDDFDLDEAFARSIRLKALLMRGHRYDVVLCCGVRVAKLMDAPLLEVDVTSMTAQRLAGLPHPGGTNRWWNDLEHRTEADEFLMKLGTTL